MFDTLVAQANVERHAQRAKYKAEEQAKTRATEAQW